MRKLQFALCTQLLCLVTFADQVSILFRDRPDSRVLWKLAAIHGGGKSFSEIPIQERIRFKKWVDPFVVGHVAVKFEDPHTKKIRIVGWTPAFARSAEEIDSLLNYYLTGSVFDTKVPVRGAFNDDTEWARGAMFDPVHEVPLNATASQVVSLADEIDRVHQRSWHGYQVLPNYNPSQDSWSYPQHSFNCLEGVRRVLNAARIRVPFTILENGLLPRFIRDATPFVRNKYYGQSCPQEMARHFPEWPEYGSF